MFLNITCFINYTGYKTNFSDPKFLSVMIQASGNFEVLINNAKISDGAHVILSGQIEALSDTTNIKLKTQQNILKATTVHQYQFYNVMKNAGYYLTDIFALMKELSFNETGRTKII